MDAFGAKIQNKSSSQDIKDIKDIKEKNETNNKINEDECNISEDVEGEIVNKIEQSIIIPQKREAKENDKNVKKIQAERKTSLDNNCNRQEFKFGKNLFNRTANEKDIEVPDVAKNGVKIKDIQGIENGFIITLLKNDKQYKSIELKFRFEDIPKSKPKYTLIHLEQI